MCSSAFLKQLQDDLKLKYSHPNNELSHVAENLCWTSYLPIMYPTIMYPDIEYLVILYPVIMYHQYVSCHYEP